MWFLLCFCLRASSRQQRGWSRGRGFPSAAEDQEWCFLRAHPEEVKDAQCQGLAALAHTQVLNQRTLLQPQGAINRAHTQTRASMSSHCWGVCRCGGAGLSCPFVPVHEIHNSLLWAQSTRLQCVPSSAPPGNSLCVSVLNRFQLEGFPFCFRFPVQNVQGVHVQEPQWNQVFTKQCAQYFVSCLL